MKVLILSEYGNGNSLAHQLTKEGHDVEMFIRFGSGVSDRGFVNIVESWRPHIVDADLVIADEAGYGIYEGTIKGFGKPMLGINKLTDLLSESASRCVELLEHAGISTPATFIFSNPADARSVLDSEWGTGYTVNGVECRHPDIYEWLLGLLNEDQNVNVQEILHGVKVRTEGWFNGRGWIEPTFHSFEHGVDAGGGETPDGRGAGAVVLSARGDMLTKQLLRPLESFLRDVRYRGPFGVRAIITEDGIYAYEPAACFNYSTLDAVIEGLREPLFDILFEQAVGVRKEMDVTENPMISVGVQALGVGSPILGIVKENMKHLQFDKMSANGIARYSGNGYALRATAIGRDVREARKRVYRTVDRLEMFSKAYSPHIGVDVDKDVRHLKSWGYL